MRLTKYDLSVNELMLLNSELRSAEKSLALAYLMLIGGHLGVHRFYLKRFGTAIAQLVLFLLALALYVILVVMVEMASYDFYDYEWSGGPIAMLVLLILAGGTLFVWVIVDLFLIPRMVREWNERVERELLDELARMRAATPPPPQLTK